jgi:hypothetical protein
VIRKGATPAAVKELLRVAESMEPHVRDAFLAAVAAARKTVSTKDLVAAIESRDVNRIMAVLDINRRMEAAAAGAGLPASQRSVAEALQQTYIKAAEAALKTLPSKVSLGMSMDMLNPQAVAFLRGYTFELIRQISDESRKAVQSIVTQAFLDGGHPYEQARALRGKIGLTEAQAQAVENFRRSLLESQFSPASLDTALSRELRDHRYDATLRAARQGRIVLSRAQIADMARRYEERFLQYRARMIARTETLRASNAGQNELWRQAEEQGLLDQRTVRRRWILSIVRTCQNCESTARQNEDGVPLGQPFATPFGHVDYPPIHPHCRCTVGLFWVKP